MFVKTTKCVNTLLVLINTFLTIEQQNQHPFIPFVPVMRREISASQTEMEAQGGMQTGPS